MPNCISNNITFPPQNIFYLLLVESMGAELADTEGRMLKELRGLDPDDLPVILPGEICSYPV